MNGPTFRIVARNDRQIPPKPVPVTAPDVAASQLNYDAADAIGFTADVAALAVKLAHLNLLNPGSVKALSRIVDKLVEKAEGDN
jgi:hypothetical protein